MPPPVPVPLRRALWQRCQRGQTPAAIARELRLPVSTVRKLVRRLRDGGAPALAPSYHACGRHNTTAHSPLRAQALTLRQQHPRWGAGRIRLELQRRAPGAAVPDERTLQRWLRQDHQPPAPPGRPRQEVPPRATRPHQRWQVDAADQKTLATGEGVSWLRAADECSGAVLRTAVFSRAALQPRAGAADPAAIPPGLRDLGAAGGVPL